MSQRPSDKAKRLLSAMSGAGHIGDG